MKKENLFNESDLQIYEDNVNIEIAPEDYFESLLRKYGKKFFLISSNKGWDIRSYKNLEEVNSYFAKNKPGFSKKGEIN